MHMLKAKWIAAVPVLSMILACGSGDSAPAAEDGDGADDSFVVDGKTDIAGIAEGTAEACGVLRVANDSTFEELDKAVGLASNAAQNIAAVRAGADGVMKTADDGYFDSLAELDAVKYVGPKSFSKMAGHASGNGWTCKEVELQVLSISDLHGQLDPVSTAAGKVGGVAALSSYFTADRVANPRTLTLSAGDSFGASPPLAAFFQEKPVIEAMNLMRFDVEAPGNHSFDQGAAALRSLIEMASFPFVSANLAKVQDTMTCDSRPDKQCIAPFQLLWVGGVKVAVVGLMTTELPELVKPGALGSIEVLDPVAPALAAREKAAGMGAQVFVALTHIGGVAGATPEAAPTGPLLDLAQQLAGFDLIIGGHTHVALNTQVNGITVVENPSQGQSYSRAQLKFDFATRSVTSRSAQSVQPLSDNVTPDQAIVDLLAPYRTLVSQALDAKIGVASGLFERGNNVERLKEVPLGDLLADAIRARYATQIGWINGGGIRASLPSSYAPADSSLRRLAEGTTGPYDLVVGDVFAVLPFANDAATCTVTGAQLYAMAEHGVDALPAPKGYFPQVSGIKITFDSKAAVGSRIKSIVLEDQAQTPVQKNDTSYSLATVDFVLSGGDGYNMLIGVPGDVREKLTDAVVEHIKAAGTIIPETKGRLVDIAATP